MAKSPSPGTLLGRYRAKRNFSVTPEPSGQEKSARPSAGMFVVQKHAATRLHYDFRLELGGVLKSWAVTKGPSLDPHDRRLAVEVEDHPIGYGDFEGLHPQGQYGGGTVMLWDRGRWEPEGDPHEGLAKGHLKFRLFGERMKGGWALVRMTGRAANPRHPNWLLIKERDGEARDGGKPLIERAIKSVASGRSMDDIATERDRVWQSKKADPPRKPTKRVAGKARLPAFIAPELATRVERPPAGPDWLHEIKFDGYRLLARVGGEVKLLTRRGKDWTDRFPDIAAALAGIDCAQALIDGEAVALDQRGVSDFGRLQEALAGQARHRITFEAFDLLHLDGIDLTAKPLEERKALLQPLIKGLGRRGTVLYSDHLDGGGDRVFAHACQMALEGVISKRKRAPYRSGRGDDWVKSKCVERQEFVIGGYARSAVAGKELRSLLVGYYEGKGLRYAGRVGTGFNAASSADLRRALDRIERAANPFDTVPPDAKRGVVWVEPRLVCEVEFLAWTSDRILRHASFKGLREDKRAREITIERPAEPPRARR